MCFVNRNMQPVSCRGICFRRWGYPGESRVSSLSSRKLIKKKASEPNVPPGLPWGFSHRPCCTYWALAVLCQSLLMSEYQQ